MKDDIFILRYGHISKGKIRHRHPVLKGCFSVDVYQDGFGPKVKEEIIPSHCIHNTWVELEDSVFEEIESLKKQLSRFEKDFELVKESE